MVPATAKGTISDEASTGSRPWYLFQFFGEIRRSTLLRSPSYGGSVRAYSAEAAASAAKAGRIHPQADAWGFLRRRISTRRLDQAVWNGSTKAPHSLGSLSIACRL